MLRPGARADAPELTLTEIAYTEIKQRILSLELRPGQFVNEQKLGEMVGLGRMPVHQAVHRLMADGLLDVIARKGIIIRLDSLNEVLDLLEARSAVEPNIAALAARRADSRQIKSMKRLLAESRKFVDQRQRREFMGFDRAFHQAVAEAAGNRILVDAQRPLHERSARIWGIRVWGPDGLRLTQHEHELVLEAIARGDARGARSAMQSHIDLLRARIVEGAEQAGELVPAV